MLQIHPCPSAVADGHRRLGRSGWAVARPLDRRRQPQPSLDSLRILDGNAIAGATHGLERVAQAEVSKLTAERRHICIHRCFGEAQSLRQHLARHQRTPGVEQFLQDGCNPKATKAISVRA